MKVLVLDEALPVPADSGKRIRTFELLRRLAQRHAITFLAPEERPTPPEEVARLAEHGIEVRLVRRRPLVKRGARFAWDLLRNVFLPVPYMVMGHRVRAVRDEAAALLSRRSYDLIHVEWTPLVVNVPEGARVPVLVCAHNVESDIWARYLVSEAGLARRAYVRLQLGKVRRFERAALAAADAVTAVSEGDAERIRAWAGQPRVSVVANGVDAERFAPQPDAVVSPHEAVFVGSLDWRPNQDGVLWFLDEVFPALRARVPDATLAVVGRAPPPWFVERVTKVAGASVHGSVTDVRPFLARAAVSVVPLRVGGGSRLKICESLAMERPVVSTSVGAEGLDRGAGIVLADEPQAFVEAIVATLDDPTAARAAAREGRARVLATNEWGAIAPNLERAWVDAARSRRTGRPS